MFFHPEVQGFSPLSQAGMYVVVGRKHSAGDGRPFRHRPAGRTTNTKHRPKKTPSSPSSYFVPHHPLPFFSNRASDDGDDEDPEQSLKGADADADADTSSDSTPASASGAAKEEATGPLSAAPVSNPSEYIGPMPPEPVSFANRAAYAEGGDGSGGDHSTSPHNLPIAGTPTWKRRVSENGLRHCGGGGAFQVQDPRGSMRRSSTGGIGGRAVYGRHRGDSSESELTDINDEVRWEGGERGGAG